MILIQREDLGFWAIRLFVTLLKITDVLTTVPLLVSGQELILQIDDCGARSCHLRSVLWQNMSPQLLSQEYTMTLQPAQATGPCPQVALCCDVGERIRGTAAGVQRQRLLTLKGYLGKVKLATNVSLLFITFIGDVPYQTGCIFKLNVSMDFQ